MNNFEYCHPITGKKLKDVNEFANAFHDEIIDPFELKTGLKVSGWNDYGMNVGIDREHANTRLPIWFVLMILNDWKKIKEN